MHNVFAFTDIHGMYDLYKAVMDYCNEQDPEATIVFCGDACDRGRDGYKIMNELLDNPHVVYLKGNHEDLFVKAAREIKEYFDFTNATREEVVKRINVCRNFEYQYEAINLSLYNGGIDTLADWVIDGMSMEFVDRINNLPYTFSTDTCDFCHSAGVYRTFKEVANAEYNNEKADSFFYESLLWTRSAFEAEWEYNRTAIFGHTPVPCLNQYMDVPWNDEIDIQPYKWAAGEGFKIDMDTGAAFIGNVYVLNTLTMQAQGFEDLNVTAKEKVHHEVKKIDCIQM